MVPLAGIEQMVLVVAASGFVLAVLAGVAVGRFGFVGAWAFAGLAWSLVTIAVVTLLPTDAAIGTIPAGEAQTECSFDYGGPAPDGFWIFSGTQRVLNTALFVPAGALVVVVAARWRTGWSLAPLGLALLVLLSIGIEWTQLELSRLDRACDVTDVVDNATGAGLGFLLGLVLVMLLRPWRDRRARRV